MAARKRIIQPGGTRGTVFRQVAHIRLEDADVLLRQRRYGGAVYLAGYAVECLLKWAVTNKRGCIYLPAELETHDLDKLLLEAGMVPILAKEAELRALFWALAETWGPELRYLAMAPNPVDATKLYAKILKVYDWLTEQTV